MDSWLVLSSIGWSTGLGGCPYLILRNTLSNSYWRGYCFWRLFNVNASLHSETNFFLMAFKKTQYFYLEILVVAAKRKYFDATNAMFVKRGVLSGSKVFVNGEVR